MDRGNSHNQPGVGALQCTAGSLGPMPAGEHDAASPACLQSGSGASRQPTEQEIQNMDDLDLTMNLGSLLGPGDSWIDEDHVNFAALEQSHHKTDTNAAGVDNKPFQELFSAAH